MRSLVLILTVAAALLDAHAARGQPAMTAGDLAQLCGGSDHVSRNACRVYILGVTQGIAVGIRIAGGKSSASRPCVRSGISGEELEAALKKKLGTLDSAAEQQDAAGFIGNALLADFPCGGSRR